MHQLDVVAASGDPTLPACQASSGTTLAGATGVVLVIESVGVWPVEPGHKLAVGGP
jgi:hypothetical protein